MLKENVRLLRGGENKNLKKYIEALRNDVSAERDIEEIFESCMDKNGELMLSVGDKIKYYRKAKGYSREELARITGISVSTLARIEKNENGVLSKKHGKIAAEVNMTLNRLLEEDPEDKTKMLREMIANM